MSSPEPIQTSPRSLRMTFKGDVRTELDQVISDIPWGDAFTFGAGIDAITGSVTGSAVKPFTPTQRTVKTSHEQYSFIQSESELNREIEAAASGKYNIEGVTINASASYLTKIKFSEMCITLIARFHSQYDGYDEAPSYELTDAAKTMIGDPAKFRKAYGDYFVSGGRRSSLFIGVYVCQTSTVESMNDFKASFGGEAPDVFSAEGSTHFMQSAKEHNVSITVDLFLEGYTGTAPSGPWTPEKIMEALTWFKANQQGIDLTAKLRHYSTIDPNYPRTVDVAPDVFVELRQLYTAVWDVRAGYNALPSYYLRQYKEEFTALDAGVTANQAILATDAAKRMQYRQQAESLLGEINKVYDRMDFYYKVKSLVHTEPAPGQEIYEDGSTHTWMYGFSTYTKSSAVTIQTNEQRYRDDWHVGWREATLQLGPDDSKLMVGWQVIANWTDGTDGRWWRVAGILLTNIGAVHVKSLYDRGCDWTVKYYYVDSKDYQF